jgi:3-isopropylmalate dehydratase large subunit
MHAIEKILAQASGRQSTCAGEIVTAAVDVAETNDLYLQVVSSFHKLGGTQVKEPEKAVFVFDHYSPAPTIKAADNHKQMREFCAQQGIRHLYDIGAGVCHQVLLENGLVAPGSVVVETDSHTVTMGAMGAFGTGVGATDMATILLTGKLWFRVPEIMRIHLDGGPLKPGVMAKDIILHIIGQLKQDAAIYKCVEFTGDALASLPMDERLVLCNMTVEMGAKTSYIQPDAITFGYLASLGITAKRTVYTDSDFVYPEEYHFDVSAIEPQIALPGSVDSVDELGNHEGVHLDQIFIGTCTGGRLNDLAVAAGILKGKKVARGTRLVVIPASAHIFKRALEEGYVQTLTEAGAVFSTPGCGPCLGAHEGVLAGGETCLTTSSRNFPGRMGSNQSSLYIGSPAAAAAAALKGCISDPAGLNKDGN